MSSLFQNLLIWHVILGLCAIAFSVAALVGLFKKHPSLRFLKTTSLLTLLGFVGSWILGGYYYVGHYGKGPKLIIKAGDYRWIHSIIMETKEHIFLVLPFLSFVAALAIFLIGKRFIEEPKLKKAITVLMLIIVILGIVITFMGMSISGAVNQ